MKCDIGARDLNKVRRLETLAVRAAAAELFETTL